MAVGRREIPPPMPDVLTGGGFSAGWRISMRRRDLSAPSVMGWSG